MNEKKGFYLPNGQFKSLENSQREIPREKRVPDLTPDDIRAIETCLQFYMQKYANKELQNVFPKMRSEIEGAFEKMGFGVSVKPIFSPDTPQEVHYFNKCKAQGYQPIVVEVEERLEDPEGTHEKELYEWKHRGSSKKAFSRRKRSWN